MWCNNLFHIDIYIYNIYVQRTHIHVCVVCTGTACIHALSMLHMKCKMDECLIWISTLDKTSGKWIPLPLSVWFLYVCALRCAISCRFVCVVAPRRGAYSIAKWDCTAHGWMNWVSALKTSVAKTGITNIRSIQQQQQQRQHQQHLIAIYVERWNYSYPTLLFFLLILFKFFSFWFSYQVMKMAHQKQHSVCVHGLPYNWALGHRPTCKGD